jgi:radical SAM family uncharacterized protein/radical SAM-linked protein
MPQNTASSGCSLEGELARILPLVEKPARYIGGEWNEVRKDPARVRLRIGLAFPDIYEIGMSYLGQKILYHLLNAKPGLAAERVFAPWPDMEAALRRAGLPLVSLESKTPLDRLDILGFSLLYELNDSNIMTILDLGRIPLLSAERGAEHPLVIAGGPAAFNPEPLARFFDAFLVGDGEEAFPEIAETYLDLKSRGLHRERVLEELSRIRGVYVPSLYSAETPPGSRLSVPVPRAGAPARVMKRVLSRLPSTYPERIIVPHVQAVFDRVALEVARGCPQRCRFCQATNIYFPHRPLAPSTVIMSALNSLRSTGYEDASLSGLSVGDYPGLERTVKALMNELVPEGISLSLSSLRPQSLSQDLVDSIIKVRKTGFTLVPEAGTERLRRVINKDVTTEDLLEAARNAFSQGWRLLKLYFMIGLPTERQDDLEAIEDLVRGILDAGRRANGMTPQVNVSISSFIPKPHTPFQWLAMEDAATLQDKMGFLRSRLKRHRSVQLKIHDLPTSLLEAVFSRGDRRLAGPLIDAWTRGARFDSWKDHFRFDIWEGALSGRGLDYRDYLSALDTNAPLPWDIIETGISKEHLRRELGKALREEATPSCGETNCRDCLGCAAELRGIKPGEDSLTVESLPPLLIGAEVTAVLRYRAFFAKEGPARFLSHNDLANALRRAFRRAGISVLRSAGFHPKMLVSYLPALPLGMEGREECLDFKSNREFSEAEFLERVNSSLPRGIRFLSLVRLDEKQPKLGEALGGMVYSLDWRHPDVQLSVLAVHRECGEGPLDDKTMIRERAREAFPQAEAQGLDVSLDEGRQRLVIELKHQAQGGLRPQDVVRAILSLEHPVYAMARERILWKEPGQIDKKV